ncbi:MAG: LysR family transcriptional regulator [Eubacteriales bacterium]|nr:LysR family transcriptional regulator [Eubacteriales bacterium]
MELKYLQTFRTIVSEGSFSKAAEKLNYTQSTITFQIGQLENELSTKLFEKIGRRMLLTKAGEQLIPYIDNVILSVDKMRCFKSNLAEYQGDLHIGIGESLLCYQMPHILKEFRKQAPNTKLFLSSMNCYDIRDELLNGNIDLGIFYENVGGYGTNIIPHPFGSYPLILIASPDIRDAYPDFITPDQNLDIPFIINEKNCIFRQIFEQYLREKSIVLDHTIELWSIPTIKNLVKNNMGISFLPKFAVEEELHTGELAEIPTGLEDIQISAVCGHHKNKWISPAMELFLNLIKVHKPGT